MRSAGRLRSRIVRALRVLLPLAALGVLSMLFLLARSPSPETAIPYVEGDGADLARRTGMTAPRFAGVSADGARVTLSAARADPAGTDGRAEDLALEWQADGVTARVRAGSGAVEGGLIRLDGGAEMTTSTGWTLSAPGFAADTAAGRVTAAVAYAREGDVIVVPIEPESALDSEAEAAIQSRLDVLMAGKTVIAIAHRLSTIAAMDRLIVMDAGRIIEQGSHAELLARGGLYARLWARQSGGFLVDEPA